MISLGAGPTSRWSTVNGTLVNRSLNFGAVGVFELSLILKQKNIICAIAKHALLCSTEAHISHACPSPFLSNSFFCSRLHIYTGPFHSSVVFKGIHFNSHVLPSSCLVASMDWRFLNYFSELSLDCLYVSAVWSWVWPKFHSIWFYHLRCWWWLLSFFSLLLSLSLMLYYIYIFFPSFAFQLANNEHPIIFWELC